MPDTYRRVSGSDAQAKTPTASSSVRGTYFWGRVDGLGYDSCRLIKLGSGWQLTGAAALWAGHRPCHLSYDVVTDERWRTRRASVSGYVGRRKVTIAIRSQRDGRWFLNGAAVADMTDCVDVDLGFTPATNQLAIRRLALRVGQRAEAPAVYLQFPEMILVRLPQGYVRATLRECAYAAPTVGYRGRLRVDTAGAVVRYPGLFVRVHGTRAGTRRSRTAAA